MLLFKDKLEPTKELKRLISRRCRKDFTSQFCNTEEERNAFKQLPKLKEGFEYSYQTALYLTGRSVGPHTDSKFVDANIVRSFFWVTRKKSKWVPIYLQVANDYVQLDVNEFTVFDDSLLHSVSSDGIWEGIAIQCYDCNSVLFKEHKNEEEH